MTSSDTLSLLACQIGIPATTSAEERDRHLEESAAKVRSRLAAQRADLVVLPELSSIDYSRDAFDRLDELAEPLEGASFRTWAAVAVETETHICYSFPRRDETGTHISIAVVTPEGDLAGFYDKLHLCQYGASMEKEYFSPGSGLFVFNVNRFTCAPIICYDIRFPELCRALVLKHGVDVILHCGAYFRDPSFPTWHAFATARAIENQVFLLSLNRAGRDYGNSLFCYPWMDETRHPDQFAEHDEDLRHILIDSCDMHKARADYSFLQDRLNRYDLPCHSGHSTSRAREFQGETVT